MADVDKKIQQHIVASEGHSAELDKAFIMGIEMVCLFCVCSNHTNQAFISYSRYDKFVCTRGLFLELAFSHNTVVSVQVSLCS